MISEKPPVIARIRKSLLSTITPPVVSATYNIPLPEDWDPITSTKIIGLLKQTYTRLESIHEGMIEVVITNQDEFKVKTKEAKQLVKYAHSGSKKSVKKSTTSRKKRLKI